MMFVHVGTCLYMFVHQDSTCFGCHISVIIIILLSSPGIDQSPRRENAVRASPRTSLLQFSEKRYSLFAPLNTCSGPIGDISKINPQHNIQATDSIEDELKINIEEDELSEDVEEDK